MLSTATCSSIRTSISLDAASQFPDTLLVNREINFSKKSDFVPFFNTLSGLYGIAVEALQKLKEDSLTDFDSLATDCACHLRALRISTIVQKLLEPSASLSSELDLKIIELTQKKGYLESINTDCTAWVDGGQKGVHPLSCLQVKARYYKFFTDHVLNVLHIKSSLESELMYVIHAYILKIIKENETIKLDNSVKCAEEKCTHVISTFDNVTREITKPEKLCIAIKAKCQGGDVAKNMITGAIYGFAKKHLTNLSVQYLLEETEKLPNSAAHEILQKSQRKNKEIVQIPDFYGLTSVFQIALQKHIPVLLKVRKCVHAHKFQEHTTPFDVYAYLVPNETGTLFEISPFSSSTPNGPLIVVEGKRSGTLVVEESTQAYIKRLMKDFNFMHFCEMDGAQHAQYIEDSGSDEVIASDSIEVLKEPQYADQAAKIVALKIEAQEKGCTLSNQSLLVLSHIFADTIHKQQEVIKQLDGVQFIECIPSVEIPEESQTVIIEEEP